MHTGRRPGQLTRLRLGDLRKTTLADERVVHVLRVPRLKQRGRRPRDEFGEVRPPPDVFQVLVAQRDHVVERVERSLGKVPPQLVPALPLFPNWAVIKRLDSNGLGVALETDEACIAGRRLRDGLRDLEVLSARTGGRLRILPKRFRYTLGSRAAREGYGPHVIAELLDHSDTQNVWVYTRVHPNFRQKVDGAVGEQLGALAKAFSPALVDPGSRKVEAVDPHLWIGTREDKVGNCGSRGFCGAEAVACYTCTHFRPWVDAPHERMLGQFLAERKAVAAAGAGEHVVAAADRNVLAAQAVIAACEARKAELTGGRS